MGRKNKFGLDYVESAIAVRNPGKDEILLATRYTGWELRKGVSVGNDNGTIGINRVSQGESSCERGSEVETSSQNRLRK